MPAARFPLNEAERLAALRSYRVLDSACEQAFDNIAHLAAQLTESPISIVSLIDSERQWFKARVGLDVDETAREHAFCAHAILNPTEMLIVPDARLDERFADNPLVQAAPDIRFYAGMPLVNPEGAALGTLCVIDREPRTLSEIQRDTLRRLAETVMTTLELRRAMNRVRELALTDLLTGLANRASLIEAIERAMAQQQRQGGAVSLLYLDLDGFKAVNDSLGHAAGDEVLRAVADTLKSTLRCQDIAGRLGGDEFAIVLTADQIEAEHAAERIRAAVESKMRPWSVTVSIGVASFVRPISADAALAKADRLMYQAKSAGKNRVRHQMAA